MNKKSADLHQQCLTPVENAAIIAALYAAREKKLARHVVLIQVTLALLSAGLVYKLSSSPQLAWALLCGGLVSIVNGTLLAWRMSRADFRHDKEAYCSGDAPHQLRLMYFYATERFMVVVMLLAFCLAELKLMPFAVLSGFVIGQAGLMVAQIFLSRINEQV